MLAQAAWLVPLAVFVCLVGAVLAIRAALASPAAAGGAAPAPAELFGPAQGPRRLTSAVSALARPRAPEQRSEMRQALVRAGFEQRHALEFYGAVRVVLALALPALVWMVMRPTEVVQSVTLAIWAAGIGYYLPVLYVNRLKEARQEELLKPFPNALDLLVTSVEAGLGLNAALITVATEIAPAAPLLADQLQRTNEEITAGIPRLEALRRLDTRTGLSEIRSLVNVLVQAERYGTGIGRALRAHAELTRHKRMLAAEERAARVAPKLTIVTVLFIMPSLFAVLLGPTIVNMVRHVIPAMTGG